VGVRRPASGSSQIAILERRPAAHSRRRGVAGLVAVCVLALGVYSVVVGSAITRPKWITEQFVQATKP